MQGGLRQRGNVRRDEGAKRGRAQVSVEPNGNVQRRALRAGLRRLLHEPNTRKSLRRTDNTLLTRKCEFT